VIDKPEAAHRLRVEKIASVEDERGVHLRFHFLEVLVRKFLPLRREDERLSIGDCLERRAAIFTFSGRRASTRPLWSRLSDRTL
jgi:hypothetical protein